MQTEVRLWAAPSVGLDEYRGTVTRCHAQAVVAIRHEAVAVQVRPMVSVVDAGEVKSFDAEVLGVVTRVKEVNVRPLDVRELGRRHRRRLDALQRRELSRRRLLGRRALNGLSILGGGSLFFR